MPNRGPGLRSPEVLVGIALAAVGFLLGSLGPCLILLSRDLRVPRGELAWLTSGFGVSLLVAGAVGVWLLGRGAPRLLRISSVVLALGVALLAAAPALLAAQAGALLLGAGGAGVVLATPVLLSGSGADRRLTRVNAGASVAALCAPLLIGALEALAGNGRLMLLVPVAPLLLVAAASTSSDVAWTDLRPGPEERAPGVGPARPPRPLGVAARWSSLVAAVSAEFAFLVWGAARLQDSGLDPARASAAAAAFPVGMAAGRLVAPRLMGVIPVVGPGVALGIVGAVVAAAPSGPLLATAALGVAGFGIAVLYPVILAQLVGTPGLGPHRGASLGAAASGTAALLAPVLLASLAAATTLRTAFLSVVPVLALVLVLGRRGAGMAR
jgi:MFS family permease